MVKLYTFSLVVFFSNYIQNIIIFKERQQKSIVILLKSFFLIAMSIAMSNIIFNKFDWIKNIDTIISFQKYLICLKILPRIHQIIEIG